jgi:hypothetical protein
MQDRDVGDTAVQPTYRFYIINPSYFGVVSAICAGSTLEFLTLVYVAFQDTGFGRHVLA